MASDDGEKAVSELSGFPGNPNFTPDLNGQFVNEFA